MSRETQQPTEVAQKNVGRYPMRILVVEDHVKTAAFISRALRAEQLAVNVLGDGDEALQTILNQAFDTVVLDIMLPGRDGVSIVRQLRAHGNPTPVLLLSARSNVNEKVKGLEAGADDYLSSYAFGRARLQPHGHP